MSRNVILINICLNLRKTRHAFDTLMRPQTFFICEQGAIPAHTCVSHTISAMETKLEVIKVGNTENKILLELI